MSPHHIEWIISVIAVIGGLLLGWKSKLPLWADILIMLSFMLILHSIKNLLIK